MEVKFSFIVTTKKLVVKFKLSNKIRQVEKILWAKLRPVYTGDFCGDLSGALATIPNRPCKLAAKKKEKKGESSKGSKKTWSPSQDEYLMSRWADADCLFNTCSADYKLSSFSWAATKNDCANS